MPLSHTPRLATRVLSNPSCLLAGLCLPRTRGPLRRTWPRRGVWPALLLSWNVSRTTQPVQSFLAMQAGEKKRSMYEDVTSVDGCCGLQLGGSSTVVFAFALVFGLVGAFGGGFLARCHVDASPNER